ncbi:MAG: hypothetical protein WBQ12_04945, partial [Candidatus Sulfotelmatobacter sp.]
GTDINRGKGRHEARPTVYMPWYRLVISWSKAMTGRLCAEFRLGELRFDLREGIKKVAGTGRATTASLS